MTQGVQGAWEKCHPPGQGATFTPQGGQALAGAQRLGGLL